MSVLVAFLFQYECDSLWIFSISRILECVCINFVLLFNLSVYVGVCRHWCFCLCQWLCDVIRLCKCVSVCVSVCFCFFVIFCWLRVRKFICFCLYEWNCFKWLYMWVLEILFMLFGFQFICVFLYVCMCLWAFVCVFVMWMFFVFFVLVTLWFC